MLFRQYGNFFAKFSSKGFAQLLVEVGLDFPNISLIFIIDFLYLFERRNYS